MDAPQYMVHAKFPDKDIRHRHVSYYCFDMDDVHDSIFLIAREHGTITWIGEKHYIGVTPNGKDMMYEYREIQEVYK